MVCVQLVLLFPPRVSFTSSGPVFLALVAQPTARHSNEKADLPIAEGDGRLRRGARGSVSEGRVRSGEFQIAGSPSEMGIRAGRNGNGRAAQKVPRWERIDRGSGLGEGEEERREKFDEWWKWAVVQVQMGQRWVRYVSLPDFGYPVGLWSRWAAMRAGRYDEYEKERRATLRRERSKRERERAEQKERETKRSRRHGCKEEE